VLPDKALVTKYCVTCHNQRSKTAGLTFDAMDLSRAGERAEVWEKVVRRLRSGSMPPAGSPRPDRVLSEAFVVSLEGALDRAAASRPSPGGPPVRRLNRIEYSNAIHDLLGLEIDVRSFLPTDESGYGFDNIADVLSVSSGLLERYILAAQKISHLAIGDPAMRPAVNSYKVSPFLVQDDRSSEELPFGSRGGTVIRYHFPVDGEYVVRIKLRRAVQNEAIFGLLNREQIDVRLDGSRIKLFTVGGECIDSEEPRCVRPPGVLTISEYMSTADHGLEARFSAKAGIGVVGVAFVQRTTAAAEGGGPTRPPQAAADDTADASELREMQVSIVQIEGPLAARGVGETASQRPLWVCRPAAAAEEDACARKIVATLARRAYRRPVTDGDIQPLLSHYRTGKTQHGFEAGVRFALEALLVSPDFLFRTERGADKAAAGAALRISDVELASRLSFFLWSSIPDEQLLDLAVRKKLSDPQVLEQQVRRMLADVRAKALVTNFAAQWLRFRDLRAMVPDPRLFPEFDDSLREAFQQETELFLDSQLREDHSVVELLNADYTFLNERLARFYRVENVYGSHFRRVKMTDPNRRGLLGHGSLLTATSYPTRTSPVVRGNYLLDVFLGAPPPPPPPNVPALIENGENGAAPTTVRERLEQHRKNPACASCHSRMDPLGFALENFDGIGKWRTTEFGRPLDSSGVLIDGTKFTNPAEFRAALLNRRDEFVRTATEKLLTYALGRGVEYPEMPVVRSIMRAAAATDSRWSSLILGIVRSTPFQTRGSQREEPASTEARLRP
jgi:hypothetical protein